MMRSTYSGKYLTMYLYINLVAKSCVLVTSTAICILLVQFMHI